MSYIAKKFGFSIILINFAIQALSKIDHISHIDKYSQLDLNSNHQLKHEWISKIGLSYCEPMQKSAGQQK